MCALDTRITFSDEQAMLQDSAVSFCRQRSPSLTVRAHLLTETGFDRTVWDEMVQLGWLGIALPERFGGSGLSIGHTATVAEPMGRHLLATPFFSTQLFIQGLLAGGNAAQQQSWLTRMGQGSIGSVALFEDDGDWDLNHLQCHTTAQGERIALHGHKTLVCDAAVADALLISVLHDGAPALAVVATADLPTTSLQRETVIDETRRSHRLRLDGLQVDAGALITGAAARSALIAIRNAAWLLASAEAAGGIAGALAVVVEYLNTRTTFGRKIGSYQALKHTCADILCGLERARSHVHHAATLMAGADDPADIEIALRMAKAEAGDTFAFTGDRAVQFHGGFGFTYDCDAQLYLRRALWLQPWFGDSAHHRRRLADQLLGVSG